MKKKNQDRRYPGKPKMSFLEIINPDIYPLAPTYGMIHKYKIISTCPASYQSSYSGIRWVTSDTGKCTGVDLTVLSQ